MTLAPIWGERECEPAAANVASRIRHGTNLEWHGGEYIVGHPPDHKCGTLGHKFGLKCCSHDPTPHQLGVQQGPEQWIVGHEEPANVARHQIGAQDPEWQRVVGHQETAKSQMWKTGSQVAVMAAKYAA